MSIRFVNHQGRAGLQLGTRVADVERASGGQFASDPMQVLAQWPSFSAWAKGISEADATSEVGPEELRAPVPRPWKVFGVGMNYRDHAKEAGLDLPSSPVIFTKFPNCICGPTDDVELHSDYVDWEVELVVVIGRRGRHISEADALAYVAGYTVGQDISDRKIQFTDKPPQFSIGKSFDTYGPTGPALVSLDSFADAQDLVLRCDLDGERVQEARTSDMIFSVSQLIAFLSRSCTLEPGDLIFTGTPAGVGSTRSPRRYLKPGEVIRSEIEGIGVLTNRCVGAAA